MGPAPTQGVFDGRQGQNVGRRVQVVAQMDRFRGGFSGDGNWTTAKRFYLTQDDDLDQVRSESVDLGEVNMSDPNTLVDFVTWAVKEFPADKYALILSDHGMGWPGGWSDPAPGGTGDPSIPLASRLGDELYLMELDEALAEIRAQTGLDQFELIGMDACLMGHLEVFDALAPHARYAVASQETEPALGWAYTGFLGPLHRNPDMTGEDLSRLIVDSYIQEDQRIVDDQARAEFLKQGSPMGGLFGLLGGQTAAQLAQQVEQNTTLTAIDLAALPALQESVNSLAFGLQEEVEGRALGIDLGDKDIARHGGVGRNLAYPLSADCQSDHLQPDLYRERLIDSPHWWRGHPERGHNWRSCLPFAGILSGQMVW